MSLNYLLPDFEFSRAIHLDKTASKKVVIKTNESIYLIDIDDLIRCEADGNYTHFHVIDGKKITVSKTLKSYEEILGEHRHFYRIHNSHLINLKFMERFDKKDGGVVIMKDKSMIPVASRKKNELLILLDNI